MDHEINGAVFPLRGWTHPNFVDLKSLFSATGTEQRCCSQNKYQDPFHSTYFLTKTSRHLYLAQVQVRFPEKTLLWRSTFGTVYHINYNTNKKDAAHLDSVFPLSSFVMALVSVGNRCLSVIMTYHSRTVPRAFVLDVQDWWILPKSSMRIQGCGSLCCFQQRQSPT